MSSPIVTRTPEQLAALRSYAVKNNLPEDIYESFYTYAQYMVPKWTNDNLDWIWAHKYICEHFQLIFDGVLDYLTIETPPQLGKSVLTSLFITYVFGSNPNLAHMYFTYNESRAIAFTKSNIFGFMASNKYKTIFPYVILKNDLSKNDHSSNVSMKKKQSTLADNKFNLINPLDLANESYRGIYSAFGLGQGAQGNPADIMIVDDYVAKGSNINSETFRATLKGAFYDDIVSRFQPSTKFIIVCTRWYEEDCIGMLMEAMADINYGYAAANLKPPAFKSIKIRAEYRTQDENPEIDPRTQDGEWLWLPMLSKYLMAKKSLNYNAMYNCDPSDVIAQNQLKAEDFGYYYPEDMPVWGGKIVICMDGASTTGNRSDHTAIGAWKVFGRKRYLIKLWYVKMIIPDLCKLCEQIITIDYPEYSEFLIEFANSGVPVSQYLKDEKKYRNITQLGFSGQSLDSNIKKPKNKRDITSKANSKMERYLRIIPEVQNREKRIFLPYYPIEHQDIFIKQMINFNGAANNADDMVDMASYFIYYTSKNIIISSNRHHDVKINNNANNGMCYNLPTKNYFLTR